MMKDSEKEIMEILESSRRRYNIPLNDLKGIYDFPFSRDDFNYNTTLNFNTKEYSIECLTTDFKNRLGTIAIMAEIIKFIAADKIYIEDRFIKLDTWKLIKIEITEAPLLENY